MSKQPRVYIACALALLLSIAGCARRASRETTTGANLANVSQPVRVPAEDGDAAEPAIAAGRDGTVYIAWVEHRGKEADVMLARMSREGLLQGTPARVNPKAGEATAWFGDPPTLAVAGDGTLYVGWTARVESPSDHADDLYLSASHDGGRTFAPPVKVNDDEKPAVHGMHSLAIASNGRIYLAWLDERNTAPVAIEKRATGNQQMESNREVFTSFSDDGGRTFSANQRVATKVCPCCKTSLAVAPDGRVYASWRQVLPGDFRHIAVASSGDGGRSFSQPVIVSDDRWMLNGCPVSGAAMGVKSDGTLRVLWYTAGEAGPPGLYWSESRDGGKTFTPRQTFAIGGVRGTPVLLPEERNDLTAVWESDDNGQVRTMVARLTSDGGVTKSTAAADDGALPAGTVTGGQIFIAYISKNNSKGSIWVTRVQTVAQT
jgi:hypothetical protein